MYLPKIHRNIIPLLICLCAWVGDSALRKGKSTDFSPGRRPFGYWLNCKLFTESYVKSFSKFIGILTWNWILTLVFASVEGKQELIRLYLPPDIFHDYRTVKGTKWVYKRQWVGFDPTPKLACALKAVTSATSFITRLLSPVNWVTTEPSLVPAIMKDQRSQWPVTTVVSIHQRQMGSSPAFYKEKCIKCSCLFGYKAPFLNHTFSGNGSVLWHTLRVSAHCSAILGFCLHFMSLKSSDLVPHTDHIACLCQYSSNTLCGLLQIHIFIWTYVQLAIGIWFVWNSQQSIFVQNVSKIACWLLVFQTEFAECLSIERLSVWDYPNSVWSVLVDNASQ